MLVALDGTVLLVAQPALQRGLGASMAQVQWTSTGYLLAVAALLVVAGRLGDRYGHVRLLCGGVLGFGAASAGIALAPSIGWVIGLRVLQGVCGALLQPATLALLRLTWPPDRLGTPVAVRTSAIAVAAGAGPVIGGVLVVQLGWQAVFWINVPMALVIAAFTLAVGAAGRAGPAGPVRSGGPVRPGGGAERGRPVLPGSRAPVPSAEAAHVRTAAEGAALVPGHRLDLGGAALLAGALAVLVHTLTGVPEQGWSAAPTLLGFLAVAGLAAVLVLHERRTEEPIVPRAVSRCVPVTASMAMLLVTAAGLFGALFTATFQLQSVMRLDPLATGLRVLPMTVLMVVGAPVAGVAVRRFGPRATALAGTVLVSLGIAGLTGLGPGTPWVFPGVTFAVLGAGFATVMVTATGTVVGDAPAGYAGVVGGLKQTAMNIGPALGIALAAGTAGVPAAAVAAAPSGPSVGAAFLLLAGCAALAVLPALLLPARPGRREQVPVPVPVATERKPRRSTDCSRTGGAGRSGPPRR
ncbi:MFS transporter [Streptomyces sp. NPDC004111]|uniref:MFS transporter n=1 Tax=Streptomyces sp. NPDC004111 TaxID=3364690 RepID=UPI0036D0C221